MRSIGKAILFVAVWLGVGAVAMPFASAQQEPPIPPVEEPLVLEVVTDANGNVTVNGIVFEAALGVDAAQIVELVNAGRSSVDALLGASEAVQERVNTVIMTVQ